MEFNVLDFAKQKLKEYELDYTVGYDNKKTSHGYCSYRKKHISFSSYAVSQLTESQQKALALHEIAHAIVGAGHGHNKVWRDTCLAIGGNGQRLGPATNVRANHAKWVAYCPNCQKTTLKFKRYDLACGKCCNRFNGGEYTEKYKLIYEPRNKS